MKSTIPQNELYNLYRAAVDALNDRSTVLEQAHSMSKSQLTHEIDTRLTQIHSGNLSDEETKQIKAEASGLAAFKLRKG